MGRLTTIDKLELPLNWHFEDAYYNNGKWHISFPNSNYLYRLAIHNDTLRENNALRIEIRKWIERNIDDLVIIEHIDKTYFQYYSETRARNGGYQISNNWSGFYFEKEESAIMFKLKFGEFITEVTEKHPRYLDET